MEPLIVVDPLIRSGRPTIRGTRISVGDILSLLGHGMTKDEILDDFPQLRSERVVACLLWADREENGRIAA